MPSHSNMILWCTCLASYSFRLILKGYLAKDWYNYIKRISIFFRVPGSRFFNTLYPQPIMLSAGTSYTLPITFRPLEKLIYEDKIEFETKVNT